MSKLLRKIFIKDYKNVEDPLIRKKHGYLSSFVGIFTNLILVVFKLLIGIITASISIIGDAINNLVDMTSCIVNLLGFKLANKPADKKHPFGHERIEYITGLIISFIIIALAVVLGYSSINKIISGELSNPNIYTFIILGVAILIKLWQSFFYRRMAKAINSVSIKANATDSLNDAIATTCVLIASIVEYATKGKVNLDGYMGVAVAAFIIFGGIKLVIETANPLIGITPDHELVKGIVSDILGYEGVLGVHDIMCHSYGPTKLFMTIHVEVDSRVDVLQSHDLIDNIESEVGKKRNVLLTIHMDPVQMQSEEINDLKEKTRVILQQIDGRLSFHDFRIVKGETHTNVLFDVVVPFEIKTKKIDILNILVSQYRLIDEKYHLVINFDSDFVNGD